MASESVLARGRNEADRTSVAASAGVGVLAAAVGYVLSAILIASEAGEDIADWIAIAWYHYNAHMVDVEWTGTGSIGDFGGSRSGTIDFIAQSESTAATLLYLVPPVVLLLAGAALAVQFDARDIGTGVLVGAPVTIGYAVVMGLGTLVAETSGEWSLGGLELSGTMAPELVPAIVLAGLLYPLVFATMGAVLTAVLRS